MNSYSAFQQNRQIPRQFQRAGCYYFSLFLGILGILSLLYGSLTQANAADVSVQASLSQSTATVGEAVDLEIRVNGARGGRTPREIQVEGLSINYNGESTSMQMNNFNVSVSVTYTYSVVPQRAGTFTIPAQTIEVNGKSYTTQPMTLSVGASAAGADSNDNLAFAELVIPKNKAYVGEVIPVELRIYVDSRIRWQLQQLPSISGEGFTTQKLTEPIRNQLQKNGHTYDLITFKTAITPIKTGNLGIGPVEIHCVAQIPQKRKRQRLGPGDMDFNDPFGMFAPPPQAVTIRIDRNELEVKSLPPNPPKSFAGAVGTFSIASKATPTKVNVGDPITLSLAISGRGNFDRVNAPKLMEESGWRTYPASNKFKADDDIGISGVKTFEMAVIPEQVQSRLPQIEFSYFDPVTEKYVTIQAERDPISVAVVQAISPSQAQVQASNSPQTPTPTASAAPTPTPIPADIRYILTGPAPWGRSFKPVFTNKLFWQLQILPLLGVAAFAAFQFVRLRKSDSNSQRLTELRHKKAELMDRLSNATIDPQSFYDAAMQIIQLEAACHLPGHIPSSIGADQACDSKPLDQNTRERIRAIFDTCEEYRYAGSGAEKISPEKRAEIIETLKEFQSKKEQPHALS